MTSRRRRPHVSCVPTYPTRRLTDCRGRHKLKINLRFRADTPDNAVRAGAARKPMPTARLAGSSAGGSIAPSAEAVGGRILQLSKFYPPVMGGIETVAWEVTEGLNRAGIQTDVLCSHHLPATVVERVPAGYRVIRASSLGRVLSTSVAPAMVRELHRIHDQYELIHLHMPDPMAALALWAVRPRARLVVHWHSDVVRQRLAMHAYRHLQDWVLARADAIVATSEAYADSSEALRPWRNKVTVVPIGISDNRDAACDQLAASIRASHPGKRLVFSLGRMTHYKGFDVLVDAASRLPDDCVVLIGGDGELLGDLQHAVAERGLGDRVRVLGHILDHELPPYYRACDVFCMPSTVRAEAYGVAIVEAMVMGKPVVATDITGSGVPWVNIHGFTGLNVPVSDAPALAEALTRILRDEGLRKRLGAVARLRYVQEFRAELMTERMAQLYASIGVEVNTHQPFENTQPAARAVLTSAVAGAPTSSVATMPAIPLNVPSVETAG
jgi:glycosyltransferase involved in cell wall biosynthesis